MKLKVKLKVAGWLLAAAAMGVVARVLVRLSDGIQPKRDANAEVDAALREAVRQGGYRTVSVPCDLPN